MAGRAAAAASAPDRPRPGLSSGAVGTRRRQTDARPDGHRSLDNGAIWTLEAHPSGAPASGDKQMIWVDHSASSPCTNNQYATWHNGTPAFISTRSAIIERHEQSACPSSLSRTC